MSPHPTSKRAKAQKTKRSHARAARSQPEQLTKNEARLTRQIEERRQRQRQGRVRRVRSMLIIGVVAAALAAGWFVTQRPDRELAGVTRPRNQGRGHVVGATYDSAMPTSGKHDARAPSCGSYDDPLDPALAVHALEHGTVVLWYDESRPELADELEGVARDWDSHVIISPNSNLSQPIVATAWNRLKAYEPGDPEIAEFIETYRRRGPERVNCDL